MKKALILPIFLCLSFVVGLSASLFAAPDSSPHAASRQSERIDSVAPSDTTSADDSIASDSLAVDTLNTDKKVPKSGRQIKITPVDIDDQRPPIVLHYYDKHGEPLEEPVMFLATLDTVTKPKSKPVYPLYNGLDFGVNFGDAILMAAGQSYGSFDVWADVSLHNWFFPVIEAGVGFANSSPKNSNFTYKTKPSFYLKAGINYNFLYKSNPDYSFYVGLRAGFSSFKFDVENVSISNDYWGESQLINMRGLGATAFYGEVLAGLKVKIYKNFSLGWNIRYHFNLKTTAKTISKPWFIPVYGASSPIGFNFSAIFTLPSSGRKAAEKAIAAEKEAKKKH